MRKADDHDLRDALSEEVENLEPSDQLWNNIYQRSVARQEKKRIPWLQGGLAIGAAAAAAAIFLMNGLWNPGTGTTPEPPAVDTPRTLVTPFYAPGEDQPLPIGPIPGGQRFAPTTDRLFVRYNHTIYFYNGQSVPPGDLGDLLTLTTRTAGDQTAPQPDGYTNFPEAGKEVRAIQGRDPSRSIAVQTDQGWYVLDNMLEPLPTTPAP